MASEDDWSQQTDAAKAFKKATVLVYVQNRSDANCNFINKNLFTLLISIRINSLTYFYSSSSSQARPKIAEYPFTTLHPHVGVCHFKDSFSLTVADIPGLIEGAHLDRGLGHEFLRHIERTKCLAYVIDVSGANKDPIGDLKALVNELMLYDPLLAAKPALVIANKMDAKGALEGVKKLRSASVLPVIEVSAKEKIGVGQAVDALRFVLEARQREEDKILKATLEAKEQELESILTHKKLTHKKSQIDA